MFEMVQRFRYAIALGAAAVAIGVATPALADRTVLVGGTVLEGKATRKGDKVVVQLEAGEVTVPADSVLRIEKSASTVSRFDQQYAALPKGNAKARLDLADYCRDHGMRTEEHRLLLEVLDIDRDNAAARTRLGFVKTDAGWITQADAMRARGMVEHEGRWVTRAELAQADRERVEREAAAERRDAEDAEIQTRRLQLSADQAQYEAESSHLPAQAFGGGYYGYGYGYGAGYPVGYYGRAGCPNGFCGAGQSAVRPQRPSPAFATHHFNDTSLSVVKVPYRRH